MKGRALRKLSLHGKIAASVILKLLISGNERGHPTDAPQRMSGTLFSNVNKIQAMIPEDQEIFKFKIILTVINTLLCMK